jgi:hypothetical protein
LSETPYQKVRAQTSILEKVGMLIPGYRGYKQRELRREADKLVRNYLYQQLLLTKDDLRAAYQRVVDNKISEVWTDMDRLIAELDMVSSEINHAAYGYAGFFDSVKVNNERLDAMTDFDSKLTDNVLSLEQKVKKFKDEALNGHFENTRTYVNDIRTVLDLLHSLYNERTNLLHGV